MKTRHYAMLLGALLLWAAAVPAQAQSPEGGQRLHAALDGKSEVPEVGNLGGFGTAILSVNVGQSRLCFDIQVAGIETPTGAHIHRGAAGTAGEVAVDLTGASNGELAGCAEAGSELLREMLTDPGGFYVNVHTEAFPPGAIRGQLNG